MTKADYYDPELNPVYHGWAEHNIVAVLPTRPYKPQDKAKVESAVKVTGMLILARLRNMTFFSLNELNAAIWALLEELNDRPFQKRPGSRRSCYEELEKAELRPLPVEDFEIFEFKKAKVAPDYHVDVDGHYQRSLHAGQATRRDPHQAPVGAGLSSESHGREPPTQLHPRPSHNDSRAHAPAPPSPGGVDAAEIRELGATFWRCRG